MRRIRYATGTVDPRDEGVAVPETGLGSLIPRLAEQAYGTTDNTTLGNRMYGGLYAEDPTEEELAEVWAIIAAEDAPPTYDELFASAKTKMLDLGFTEDELLRVFNI